MALVLMWFFLVIGLLLVLNCYWLAAVALFPSWTDAHRDQYDRPIRALLVGLLAGVPAFWLGILLIQAHHPVWKVLGTVVVSLPVFSGLLGAAGLAERIGAGLGAGHRNDPAWNRVLRGGPVLSILGLLPFLGWFIVFPAILLSGVGAFVLAHREVREVTLPSEAKDPSSENPYSAPRRPRRRRGGPRGGRPGQSGSSRGPSSGGGAGSGSGNKPSDNP